MKTKPPYSGGRKTCQDGRDDVRVVARQQLFGPVGCVVEDRQRIVGRVPAADLHTQSPTTPTPSSH